jgi:nitrogen regulatory protein PII-like uncharacterized protein
MINTLNIGQYIYNRLNSAQSLKPLNVKIYPLIADNDAKFPFIVYKRTGMTSELTKDGSCQDDVVVEIKVVTDTYSDGVFIASIVRELIQRQYVRFDSYEINDVTLNFANEDFIENAYVQTMQFTLKINE